MNKIKDGGAAFPQSGACHEGEALDSSQLGGPGMSLRDYFAARALTTLILRTDIEFEDRFQIAVHAYGFADAMLEARNKEKKEDENET